MCLTYPSVMFELIGKFEGMYISYYSNYKDHVRDHVRECNINLIMLSFMGLQLMWIRIAQLIDDIIGGTYRVYRLIT